MSHLSLDIDNWKPIDFRSQSTVSFSFNDGHAYYGMDIDPCKFFYYLKERFGPPTVDFATVKQFFQEKDLQLGKYWCFGFYTGQYRILITGDHKVNIMVLFFNDPPEKIDFELFIIRINSILENTNLEKYQSSRYDIYINYRFLLNDLISRYKDQTQSQLEEIPDLFNLNQGTLSLDQIKSRQFDYEHDYNQWLQAVLKKVFLSLEIQVLLPIHFESLVDLAFRCKLKKAFFSYDKKYESRSKKVDIFEYFEHLSLPGKINAIKDYCGKVNHQRAKTLKNNLISFGSMQKRNKLVHGNSLLFKQLNASFYYDDNYMIGVPDHHDMKRFMASSIQETILNDKIGKEVDYYEALCEDLISLFDDEGEFRDLASGVIFGFRKHGGMISFNVDDLDILFAKTNMNTSDKN